MKTDTVLYIDCFSGVSGDMLIGALLDTNMAGIKELEDGLNGLNIKGYSLEAEWVERGGISGTKFTVLDRGVEQPLRTLTDLRKLLDESELPQEIKKKAAGIFEKLAEAEAKIHNIPLDKVHFHEIGAVDTVVDVVGSLILLERMGVDNIVSSSVNTGTGFIDCSHGRLPVPAPASLELLKGVPVYSTGADGELVTPTGAAILTSICDSYGGIPAGRMMSVGYGAGQREMEHPNLLRVMLLECREDMDTEDIIILETNIDDMNPEIYTYLSEELFLAGALDVTLTPVYMKKNRPGTKLTVLCAPELGETLRDMIFRESSTFGVRTSKGGRYCLDRKVIEVKTEYGDVKVKVGYKDGEPVTFSPEYDHCAEIARKKGVPLRKVYQETIRVLENRFEV